MIFNILHLNTHLFRRELKLSPTLFALEAVHRSQDYAQAATGLEVQEESHLK